MSSVQFDEPQIQFRTIDISGAVTHNTPFLIRFRIVKNIRQANTVMITAFFVCLIATGVVVKYGFFTNTIKYREDFTQTELKHMLPESIAKLPSKNNVKAN